MSIPPTEGNCRDYKKKQIDLCGIRAHNLQMAIIPDMCVAWDFEGVHTGRKVPKGALNNQGICLYAYAPPEN